MEAINVRFRSFFCLIILCFHTSLWADKGDLDIVVIPLMPTTITNVQLSHYDIGGTGSGPTMFNLIVSNGGLDSVTNLAVVYCIRVNSVVLSGGDQIVYKGITDPFTLQAGESISTLSNNFLQKEGTGIHQAHTIEKLKDKTLENKILDAGKIPTGKMTIQLDLVEKTGPGTQQYELIKAGDPIEIEIINVNQLDLVSPGTPADESSIILDITNPNPRFIWFSDLMTNIYDDCALCFEKDVFEINIYERKPGQHKNEALASPPIMTARTREPFFDYPISGKQLKIGKTYIWQVKGFLKGVKNTYLLSDAFIFRYSDMSDPTINLMKQALQTILYHAEDGDQYTAMLNDYDSEITVYNEGSQLTLEQLQELATEFLNKEHTITSIEIE